MTSTAVPPRPNTTTGPKVGSSARPAISSRAFGRRTIGCTVTPVTARLGLQARGALEDVGAALRTASSLVRSSLHAADIGFVHDVGREDLHGDRAALGEDGAAPPAASSGVVGERHRRDRDVVGREQAR